MTQLTKSRILYSLISILVAWCMAWTAGGTGGLATLSNLQNATAGSDPSWITGDEDEPSTPATTQSRSTYTISGGRMQ